MFERPEHFREFPLQHPYPCVPSGVLPAVHVPTMTTIQEDPDASPDAGPMSSSDADDIAVQADSDASPSAGPIPGPMSDSDAGDIAVQDGSDAGPIASPVASTDGPDASGDMPGMY